MEKLFFFFFRFWPAWPCSPAAGRLLPPARAAADPPAAQPAPQQLTTGARVPAAAPARSRGRWATSPEQSHLRRVLPVYRLPIRHPPTPATRMTTAAGRDAHRSSPLLPQAAATPQAPPPADVPAPLPRRHRGRDEDPERPPTAASCSYGSCSP
ncbi:hypothetical protein BDA96_01G193600 [Sorghum bicolor]|uniref:Uncharacterized protein n=1 Tax=Sorghum bicolor TaxID=4558 RepID=A0A921RY67_SORBI|nr:hypothetical protein BDA96_01G193600 [Sorghum bicolor]